jgi:hypothetical protein
MAKKYIPGVSGLLTEPNPVDSPANTLSEAENVIVDQRGKVQSRHGFNMEDPSVTVGPENMQEYVTRSAFATLPSIPNLKQKSRIVSTRKIDTVLIESTSVLRVMYLKYRNYGKIITYDNPTVNPDTRFRYVDITIPGRNDEYTLDEILNISNQQIIDLGLDLNSDLIFKQLNDYIIIESNHYIELYNKYDVVQINSVNYPCLVSIFGFTPSQYAYAEHVFDHVLSTQTLGGNGFRITGNFVATANYSNNAIPFYKIFEYDKDDSDIVSCAVVKQKHNLYALDRYTNGYSVTTQQIIENDLATDTFRYYLIDQNSSQLLAKNIIPFKDVTNVFLNKSTMYLQTEDGLAETSLRDVAQPASQRFFTIRWPSFPELQFTFRKSELYQNWFLSGHKCGFRYTFYRELGYTQEESSIYESEPSRVYEIFNDGEDSVIDIQFVFNTVIQANEIYKTFNEFTKLNNGRKFGIKLYRTKLIPILTNTGEYNPLSAEYFQCYDFISFDTIFTTKLIHEKEGIPPSITETAYDDYSIEEFGALSRYQLDDNRGELNIGDIISYIPNNTENNLALENDGPTLQSTPPLYNGYIYSNNKVQFRSVDTDINDIQLAKLKVVDKFIAKRTERDISEYDNYFELEDTVVRANLFSGNNTVYISEPYLEANIRPYMLITGPGIPDDTFIVFINEENDSRLRLTLSKSITATSSDTELIIKATNFQNTYILDRIPNLYLSANTQTSNNIALSLYNVELFDKYINTVEMFVKTCKIYPETELQVEIWEYEFPEFGLNTQLNPPIRLTNKLAITTETLDVVNTADEYKNSTHCVYGEEISGIRENARIKVTLDQTIEWKSKKSILVVISFTDLTNTDTELKLAPATQTRLSNVPYLYDSVSNIIGNWVDGQNPALADNGYMESSIHALCLSRCDNVFHYNLEAETYITDEAGYPTTMLPGDKLRGNIYPSFICADELTNNRFYVDIEHGFVENLPVRFGSTGIPNIDPNATYYISVENNIDTAMVEAGSDVIVLATKPGWLKQYSWFTIGGITTSDPTPNLNTTTIYKVLELSEPEGGPITIKINSPLNFPPTDTPIVVNFDGTFYFSLLDNKSFRVKTNTDELNSENNVSVGLGTGFLTIVQRNLLTRYRAFIKDIKVPIEFNDDALYNDTVLYTNPNAEGTTYTNYLAPKSAFTVPFKDYQIYAGIKKPLTATLAVVEQPGIEQLILGLYLTGTIMNPTSGYFSALNKMTILKSNRLFELDADNRALYIESSIYRDRPVELTDIQYSGFEYQTSISPPITISDDNVGWLATHYTPGYALDNVRISLYSTTTLVFPNIKKYKFGATLFERPYLTLKLTSTTNDVQYVSVQLTPFYNRNGYYPLKDKSGNRDKRFLEANNTLDTLNYAQANTETGATTIVKRTGMVPGMVEGTEDGELEADAQYKGVTINISNAASAVYHNLTANTLTINNINRFTKDKFDEPGLMLIQLLANGGLTRSYAILTYSNITTETNATNKHVFKNITVSYLSRNNTVDSPDVTNLTSTFNGLNADTINFWFLEGTTAENLPIYAYKDIATDDIYIDHTLSTITETSQIYSDTTRTAIPFTFKPHRNYESPVVGYLNKNGNITFTGPASLDQSAYLDQYAWSIVESFNRELQNRGIKAYLTKTSGTGYFQVVYPDGKYIEMINGKYDPDTREVTYYGNHEFLPALNKDSFTKVAVQNPKEQFAKNEIKWSRRKIPEIVPLANSFVLGKDTKEFIGAAQSVDDLYLFKEDGIFRLRDAGNIGLSDIPYLEGSSYQFSTTSFCVSGSSIQEINNEIIYLDQNGFMSIIDGGIQNISGAIQRDILTLIQTTPKNRIRSFKNESKGLYYCTLINEVDDTLDVKSGTYIFSTKTRQWTFMDEEIMDGIETNQHQNLVMYKQKETNVIKSTDIYQQVDTYTFDSIKRITDYNNFYITREKFTNNLVNNSADQYDWCFKFTYGLAQYTTTTGLILKFNINDYTRDNLIKYNYNTLYTDFYGLSSGHVINLFTNRNILLKFKDNYGVDFILNAKLDFIRRYNQRTNPSQIEQISYYFKFDEQLEQSRTFLDLEIWLGVPSKITFNPESGTDPDTNKLFQEYMIHTETANKGATMAFKTDSRTNFSADRRFAYDTNATNRNVFRTYIPTSMSRGRYLIRQVKHDLPLENLIITGQTVVMRDSRSTRVQKDGDNE